MSKVGVIMGSKSDLPVMQDAIDILKGFDIEVEVENMIEFKQALQCGVNRILLDNMDIPTLKRAVEINEGRAQLEASGNVTIENINEIAETGVHYISVGAITKHLHAIDLSMRFADF